jgi:hypothetical protein
MKGILVKFIGLILTLPLLQYTTDALPKMPLNGAITEEKNVEFKIASWHDESFQKGKEKYLNQEFGFRNQLIRINNQIYYSLYGIAKANGVIVGKENYLYEEKYIHAFYGMDFVGEQKVNDVTERLSAIDSAFRTMNKTLLVVLAPGKASFYPEYIPDNYKRVNDSTNYSCYKKSIEQAGLNLIDFNSWFLEQKNKSNFPLYPKTGIHWSDYGAILAIDSINKYLSKLRGYDPVTMHWNEYEKDLEKTSVIDEDIELGMNLLFKIKKPRLGYPILHFNQTGKTKPRVLNIGDSFYRNIFSTGIKDSIFSDAGFGYYLQEISSPIIGGTKDVSDVNLKELINHYDVIMLMCTEATMFNFPFNFDKKVYTLYCTPLANSELFQKKLNEIKDRIRNSAEWLTSIKEKALKNGKTVDEMIQLDAEYILNNEN